MDQEARPVAVHPFPMTNPFPTLEPIYLAYFFYGASFLFLAFSIGTKNMQGSNLRIARGLWLLALFGVCQGLREFVDIYPLIEGEHLTAREIRDIEIISTFLLTAAYLFLIHFAISLMDLGRLTRSQATAVLYSLLLLAAVLFLEWEDIPETVSIARIVHIAARNILGFAGGLLTGYGMIRYSFSREMRGLPHVISRNFYYAGLVFVLYACITTTAFSDLVSTVNASKEPFLAGSAVLMAFFIIRALNIFDVETRRKVEQQAREIVQSERLASLGKLAAGIAHEINNPLANASLGIQLARKKLGSSAEPAAIGDKLAAVEKSIDRAAAIAQELLLFSRDRETEFGPVNINDVIQSAIDQLQYRLSAVRIEQNLSAVPSVRGDRGKLRQVFINILSNAQEAMPEGGSIIIGSALRGDDVELTVSDTGAGIEPEILSRVFDPFFTTKEVGAGTGLGMYISYGIIKQHHGTIEITSQAGKGTTVTVKLPVVS